MSRTRAEDYGYEIANTIKSNTRAIVSNRRRIIAIPAGATGATGAAGADGGDGATGVAGADGSDGATGATGAAGANGSDGATGATGAAGADGNDGATGATGVTGATGAAGSDGNDGATGAAGADGSDGADGNDGAAGATGPAGPTAPAFDGITAGEAGSSKALVLDADKDIGTIRNLTINGVFTDGNYTFDTGGNVAGLGTVSCGAITSSTATFSSASTTEPVVIIKNTTNDALSARLRFVKDKGAAGAANDVCGLIEFYGDDAGQEQVLFSEIKSDVAVHTDTQEGGRLTLSVASHDGEKQPGLIISDGDAEDEVDVVIGNGAASIVSVPGLVGIGIAAPTYPLHVATNASNATDDYLYANTFNVVYYTSYYHVQGYYLKRITGNTSLPVSIYCADYISITGLILHSDSRIKESIIPKENESCLTLVRDINVYTFKYNRCYNKDDRTHTGFIAQEINDIMPEAVSIDPEHHVFKDEETNETLEIDHQMGVIETPILAVTVGAVKALDTKIEEMRNKMRTLETQNAEKDQKIQALESQVESVLARLLVLESP